MSDSEFEEEVSFYGHEYLEWAERRKHACLSYSIFEFSLGMEHAMIFITLWMYILNLVHTDHPVLFYCLVSTADFVAGLIAGEIFVRMFDNCGRIWSVGQICSGLLVLGNLVYALPYSPLLLLLGRFIAGLGSGMRPILYSEVQRLFNERRARRQTSTMVMCYSLGVLCGPVINFLFVSIDFTVGTLHVTYANMPGFFLAIVALINQIILFFKSTDLSEEFKTLAEGDELSISSSKKSKSQVADSMSVETVVYKSMTHLDTCLIVVSTFFFGFTSVASEMWIPMVVVSEIGWGIKAMNLVALGSGAMSLLLLVLLIWMPFSQRDSYKIYMFVIGTIVVVLAILLGLKHEHGNQVAVGFLLFVYSILYSFVMYLEVFPLATIIKLVPSAGREHVQTLRLTAMRTGMTIGLMTAAFMFNLFHIFVPIAIALSFVIFIGLLVRQEVMMNPKVVFK